MKRKTMKTSWLATVALAFSFFVGNVLASATMVRGEVKISNGPKISFGVPVSLLQALKTSGVSAMVEDKEEFCHLVDSLMADLESMKDNHLLALEVKNEVEAHVWVEETDPVDPTQGNCVFVDIAPGNHEPEVSIRIPQGVFLLGSFMGNQFMEVHGKEVMKMIQQAFLAKIKERKHEHGHEQPHHDPQQPEQPHHAQPPIDEMHQHIQHLKGKIDHLHREGQHEEAKGLEREVDEIRRRIVEEMDRERGHEQQHHAQPPIDEMRQHIQHLREKIDHLHREGQHEEAKGLEREVDESRRRIVEEMDRERGHEQLHHAQPPIDEMRQHIQHLREKIDHLHREGQHEEAKGLEREVDEIRRRKVEEMDRERGHEQPHQELTVNSENRTRVLNEAVEYMFEAAQRLHEANVHELAEQLTREAEKYRTEINK